MLRSSSSVDLGVVVGKREGCVRIVELITNNVDSGIDPFLFPTTVLEVLSLILRVKN
jgi:hypothetical protein